VNLVIRYTAESDERFDLQVLQCIQTAADCSAASQLQKSKMRQRGSWTHSHF